MAPRSRSQLPLVLVLAFLPGIVLADAFCQRCFESYRSPGGTDSDSAGRYRLDGCPVCQDVDCKDARKHAEAMKKEYKDLRWSYEQFRKTIEEMRRGGQTISRTNQQKLDDMKARLSCFEAHYAMLEAKCPKEVPGTNIWDMLYDGPVGDSAASSSTETARDARVADQAADTYDRLSQREQEEFDTIDAFLGAKFGEYNPPPDRGYNGSRYGSTKVSKEVADSYRKQAQELKKERPGKSDRKFELTKAVEPKFAGMKVAKGGEEYVRNNGIAVRARSEGNAYILAFLQARDLHRQSVAAGNDAAAKVHSHSAVVFASQAHGYAKWAADHQHKSDVVHQKKLDEQLAAAAKKGLTLPVLLEKFQSGVKANGLPAHVADALTEAGATKTEQADVKARLLAMTPKGVEAFLEERRARIAKGAEVPDGPILALQLMVARQTHHKTSIKK